MKNELAPILSTKSASAFYGIQQQNIPTITTTPTTLNNGARIGTAVGSGVQVASGILGAINSFNSASGLSGSIDTLVSGTQLQLSQIDASLNQGKINSTRKQNLLMQQQQQDILRSNIDTSSDIALKTFNEDYINKLNEDFINEINSTVAKVNTLYQAKNQSQQIVSAQSQQAFGGLSNLLSAGMGAATLIALL